MNTQRWPWRTIKQFQRAREIQIRIGGNQLGWRDPIHRFSEQNGCGARLLHFVRIFGIGQEGELILRRLLHSSHARYFKPLIGGAIARALMDLTAQGQR